jgi:hypothetical protein
MAFKVVQSLDQVSTKPTGIWKKKTKVADKSLPNLKETLEIEIYRQSGEMRARRRDLSLEWNPERHYVLTRRASEIIVAIMRYHMENKQHDRLYVVPNFSLNKNFAEAVETKANLPPSECKTLADFVRKYEKKMEQQR